MVDLSREQPLRITEVAALFGVHRRTVENWFDRGLEHVQVGRLLYTTREALQRFGKHGEASAESQDSSGMSSERKAAVAASRKKHRV